MQNVDFKEKTNSNRDKIIYYHINYIEEKYYPY